jgi:lipoprotein-anchoring transpeptidase ErfK/SrfK
MLRLSTIVAVWISGIALAKPPWKPHPITVIPGVPLKPDDIKPYVPPRLAAEPPLDPTTVKSILVQVPDAVVSIRPWSSPLVGTVAEGTRVAVKGTVKANKGGCSKLWYAVEPFGYMCSHDVRPSDEPPTTEPTLKVREGSRLPFQYVMVLVKEGDKVPMWGTLDDLKKQAEPERQVERGDTIAIEKQIVWDNEKYWLTVEGKVLPVKGSAMMGGGAEWHGIELTDLNNPAPLPFGWITPEKANVYETAPEKPASKATPAQLERRTRVAILGEQMMGKRKWLKVSVAAPPPAPSFGNIFADSAQKKASAFVAPSPAPLPQEMWVAADAVNEARVLARPKTVPENIDKWIDVDLGEQVLVAYEKDKPVFATLVSSGRAIPTPMGTYPVWAKAAAITMKNQGYEDKEYFVNKVPWSTFFQWHNAIHGAYWHDKFGVVKSHGCVNVSPLDARYVFEWVAPPLPPGWTGLRPLDLLASPHVVVRNSHMKNQFRQDRPIGAPDKELESQRLQEAEARRATELESAQQQQQAAPGQTPPPPDNTPSH